MLRVGGGIFVSGVAAGTEVLGVSRAEMVSDHKRGDRIGIVLHILHMLTL